MRNKHAHVQFALRIESLYIGAQVISLQLKLQEVGIKLKDTSIRSMLFPDVVLVSNGNDVSTIEPTLENNSVNTSNDFIDKEEEEEEVEEFVEEEEEEEEEEVIEEIQTPNKLEENKNTYVEVISTTTSAATGKNKLGSSIEKKRSTRSKKEKV